MNFTENSMLVQLWVKWLTKENSPYTLEDVPNLYNLKEVVEGVVNNQ